MKRLISTVILMLIIVNCSLAQQYMLYNSRALYDAFENPSQKAFYADSSYKYAFNFLVPALHLNGSIDGPATSFFRSLMFDNGSDISQLDPMDTKVNTVGANINAYLAMFRVFTDVKSYKEMGFSWQVRNDSHAEVSNAFVVLSQEQNPFNGGISYIDALNVTSFTQSYHQFSFTYRRNSARNKKIGLGIKLSYLSGINYNYIETRDSYLNRNGASLRLNTNALVRSNHTYKEPTDAEIRSWLIPGFKNPGASVTLSANFKLKNDWYLMANLKDVGFIYWRDLYEYRGAPFDFQIYPELPDISVGDRIIDQLDDNLKRTNVAVPTNGKVEVLVNKNLDFYQPNLIASKNLFYTGWDMALVNNFHLNNFVLSASAAYNPDTSLQLGGQLMLKSPNFEFYLGSNQLIGTYQNVRRLVNSNAGLGSGYIGASLYFGLGIKFGRVVYHRENSPSVPLKR